MNLNIEELDLLCDALIQFVFNNMLPLDDENRVFDIVKKLRALRRAKTNE